MSADAVSEPDGRVIEAGAADLPATRVLRDQGCKLPGRLETTDVLPRGATDKVLKFQLSEALL